MIIWDLVLAFWNFLASVSSALSAVNLYFLAGEKAKKVSLPPIALRFYDIP
jgi:hypothetical protein